ncbi:MAG: CoA transferase [Dehalococcoidia bacterium]|nr:MAG: CoA transferase [Dehalococcoidia bacterium]
MPPNVAPYRGLTVVNASRGLAGATTAQLLAGLGARVIRVEEPARGQEPSPSRSVVNGWDRDGDLFMHFGRGSESIVLDLDAADGRTALARLAAKAQVVIEDEQPKDPRGVRAALRSARVGDAAFTLASITPFGLSGPWMDLPASELILFAMSGLMAHVGEPTGEPVQVPGWMVQGHVGLAAFTGIASTLPIDGGPVTSHDLDIASVEVLHNSNPHAIADYHYKGAVQHRQGSRGIDGYPWTVIPCKDGFVGIIVPQTRWDIFALWMDRPDLITDPKFSDRLGRRQHPDELDVIMIDWASHLTKAELYVGGQERGLPFGAVFTVADSLDSPQLAERHFFGLAEDGRTKLAGLPFRLGAVRPTVGHAPTLGEQGAKIASEFGLTAGKGA